jgi:hypothetical protein
MRITSLKALAILTASALAGSALAADMTPKQKKAAAAQMEKKPAKQLAGRAKAVKAAAPAVAKAGPKMATKPAGSCGTNMYWKGGQCMDARNKKG